MKTARSDADAYNDNAIVNCDRASNILSAIERILAEYCQESRLKWGHCLKSDNRKTTKTDYEMQRPIFQGKKESSPTHLFHCPSILCIH